MAPCARGVSGRRVSDRGAPAAAVVLMAEDLSTWAVPELVQPERSGRAVRGLPRCLLGPRRRSTTMRLAWRWRCPWPSGNPWTLSWKPASWCGKLSTATVPLPSKARPGAGKCVRAATGPGDGLRPHVFVTVTRPG